MPTVTRNGTAPSSNGIAAEAAPEADIATQAENDPDADAINDLFDTEQRMLRVQQVSRGITYETRLDLGDRLTAKKKKVGQGMWGEWVENNLQFTQQMANRYMRFAASVAKEKLKPGFNSDDLPAIWKRIRRKPREQPKENKQPQSPLPSHAVLPKAVSLIHLLTELDAALAGPFGLDHHTYERKHGISDDDFHKCQWVLALMGRENHDQIRWRTKAQEDGTKKLAGEYKPDVLPLFVSSLSEEEINMLKAKRQQKQ
jgi:Protein of unknown function (DUF3102)